MSSADADLLLLIEWLGRLGAGSAALALGMSLPRRSVRALLQPALRTPLHLGAAWILLTLVCQYIAGATLFMSLIAGAALAPADPLLTSAVLRTRPGSTAPADARLRAPRQTVAVRTGAADFVVVPLVLLPLSLMAGEPGGWVMREVLWSSAGGAALGVAAGLAARRLPRALAWAAAAAFTLLLLPALGCHGLVGAFAAGLMLRGRAVPRFLNLLPLLLLVPLAVAVGVWWPGGPEPIWTGSGAAVWIFATLVVAVRTLAAVVVPGRVPRSVDWGARLRIAVLTPAGASALFYAALASVAVADGAALELVAPVVLLSTLLASAVALTPRGSAPLRQDPAAAGP